MKEEPEIVEPSEILLPPSKEAKKEKEAVQINPWARFLARMTDYAVFSLLFSLLGYVFSPAFIIKSYNFFIPILFFLWIPIEALFISFTGTTPGKLLLGIKVLKQPKGKLDYKMALKRSFLVWLKGMGLGIPVVSIVTMLVAFFRLKSHGITSWDFQEKTKVLHAHIHIVRLLIAVGIVIAFLISDKYF
jgi:uncharacterized RDD family membrane protein YckC